MLFVNTRLITLTSLAILTALFLSLWPRSISTAQDGDLLNIGFLGAYPIQHVSFDVYVQDNLAYVAADDLFIIDVSDPTNPTLVSRYDGIIYDDRTEKDYDTLALGTSVQVIDNLAYIADGYRTLNVADISNLANPEAKGSYPSEIQGVRVQVTDNLAYVAGKGLIVLDTSRLNGFTQASEARESYLGGYSDGCYLERGVNAGLSRDVQVVNNLAYVTSDGCGLMIIDISNPGNTSLVGLYDTLSEPVNLQVVDNLAYIAAKSGGLQIIDVSDPTNPTLRGSYETAGDAQDVQVVDNLAYVLNRERLVEVLDVSDPAAPVLYAVSDDAIALARTYGAFASNAIYVSGDLIYVADLRGLFVFGINADEPGILPSIDSEEASLIDVLSSGAVPLSSLLPLLIIGAIVLALVVLLALLVLGLLAFFLFRGGRLAPLARVPKAPSSSKSVKPKPQKTETSKNIDKLKESIDVSKATGKPSIWGNNIIQRGWDYEDLKDANIAGNYPVIDDFRDGIATSYKTIDLEAKTYSQTTKGLRNKIKSYVDKLDEFDGASYGGHHVEGSEITEKVLSIGIPEGKITDAQREAIQEAYEYAQEKGVTLIIEEVP